MQSAGESYVSLISVCYCDSLGRVGARRVQRRIDISKSAAMHDQRVV